MLVPFTRDDLASDLVRLGIAQGDIVMIHAALSRIGSVLGGPDTVIAALRDAVGPQGTIAAYCDWNADYEELLEASGRVAAQWRDHVPPYDPLTSRAVRDNGVFPEFLRTTAGAVRSANPGASVAAVGAKADWLTADHPFDYGYGHRSPFGKLASAGGKVLMLGAPLDTMSIIHHAEQLAQISGKRIKRAEVPYRTTSGIEWRMFEEFDTGNAVCSALDGRDYFTEIVESYLDGGEGARGDIGKASSVLVSAEGIVNHAVAWLEREVS
ncbi:aminoglycoside 3-N-acetyltransferase [Pelagibacterium lentulum]|uniref:Aminoglycoside N(3)-acetyltransferase n=1 Tax=Pelagibacterium lentulum TaxID=2029865 RepID=A0A916RHZ4_9HYPH|nr:aminoglycoside 3-N-acetyltransferase [Pelagibacterium lentulum]GGA57347.1 AAC(3) family N-acetyltransferase [Pelagibacterium lentulum]